MRHHSAHHANQSLFVIQDADHIEAPNRPKWVADWLDFTLNFYFFTFFIFTFLASKEACIPNTQIPRDAREMHRDRAL